MGNELSMMSRAEVTTRYAKVYAKASKKDKGRILGEVVGVTRWLRGNARHRLTAAAKRPPGGGRAGREEAEETTLAEVLLRHRECAAAGVGGLGWPMWEVPRGLDAHPARRAGTPR